MPLPGTPHVAKMGLLFTFGTDGQQCENTFYLLDTSDAIFADPTATCVNIQGHANTTLIPSLSKFVSLTGISFEDVRVFPFGGLTVGITPLPGTGTSTGLAIPSSCALAVRKNTGSLGRSARGRWYWPLGDTDTLGATNDTVNAPHAALYPAALQNFQDALETAFAGVSFGFVSYRNGGVQRPVGVFERITSWSVVDATVDSQRRRLTGRGR